MDSQLLKFNTDDVFFSKLVTKILVSRLLGRHISNYTIYSPQTITREIRSGMCLIIDFHGPFAKVYRGQRQEWHMLNKNKEKK